MGNLAALSAPRDASIRAPPPLNFFLLPFFGRIFYYNINYLLPEVVRVNFCRFVMPPNRRGIFFSPPFNGAPN